MRIGGRLSMSALALAIILPAAPAGGFSDSHPHGARARCSLNEYKYETFHVEAEPDKDVYRIGETVKIDVTVTRPAHSDPLEQGISIDPPHSEPAEDVTISAGVSAGDVYLTGMGQPTDAQGKSVAKVKIKSYAQPGSAHFRVYASKTYLRGQANDCVLIVEYGLHEEDNAFLIVE